MATIELRSWRGRAGSLSMDLRCDGDACLLDVTLEPEGRPPSRVTWDVDGEGGLFDVKMVPVDALLALNSLKRLRDGGIPLPEDSGGPVEVMPAIVTTTFALQCVVRPLGGFHGQKYPDYIYFSVTQFLRPEGDEAGIEALFVACPVREAELRRFASELLNDVNAAISGDESTHGPVP